MRSGPKIRESSGIVMGEELLIRSIVIGAALLLSSRDPLSPGPSQRLCLPKETCTLRQVKPTEVSSRRNRLIVGEPSGKGGTPPSAAAVASRTMGGSDATPGAC